MRETDKEKLKIIMGQRLSELRKRDNKTQKAIALCLGGKTESSISQVEKGQKFLPAQDVDILCKIFNVTPNYFYGYDDKNTEKVQSLIDNSKRQLLDKLIDYIQTLYDNDHLNTRDIKTINRNEQKKP